MKSIPCCGHCNKKPRPKPGQLFRVLAPRKFLIGCGHQRRSHVNPTRGRTVGQRRSEHCLFQLSKPRFQVVSLTRDRDGVLNRCGIFRREGLQRIGDKPKLPFVADTGQICGRSIDSAGRVQIGVA